MHFQLFSLPGLFVVVGILDACTRILVTRDSQQFNRVAAVPLKHVSFVFRHAFSTATSTRSAHNSICACL